MTMILSSKKYIDMHYLIYILRIYIELSKLGDPNKESPILEKDLVTFTVTGMHIYVCG